MVRRQDINDTGYNPRPKQQSQGIAETPVGERRDRLKRKTTQAGLYQTPGEDQVAPAPDVCHSYTLE